MFLQTSLLQLRYYIAELKSINKDYGAIGIFQEILDSIANKTFSMIHKEFFCGHNDHLESSL
jgi:hypothetical protein